MDWCTKPRVALLLLARVSALAALAALAGCGDGGGDGSTGAATTPTPAPAPVVTPPAPAATATVAGVVALSSTGAAAAGVTVTLAGRTAVTAADGSFTLTDVPAGSDAILRLQRADLLDGSLAVPVVAGATRNVEARLTPVAASISVDAASAATVRSPDASAQVALAGGYVRAATAVAVTSGAVSVALTPFDTAADAANLPGSHMAAAQPIAIFGAVTLGLKDAAGATLDLAAGRPATLRIPVSARVASPPATAVLYAYDDTRGFWVASGSAALGGSGVARYYEATVARAATWAAGRDDVQVRVSGCVKDAAGANVEGARVQVVDADQSTVSVVYSAAGGAFAVALPRLASGTLQAHLGSRSSSPALVGPSAADIALPACLVLGPAGIAPQIVAQPASQTVLAGAPVTLRVDAGGSPLLAYQWLRNGTAVAGATGATLVLPAAGAADDGARYGVVVSNAFGTVTSATAVLGVTLPPPPLALTLQPRDASVLVGQTATFSTAVTGGASPVAYQWKRNGVAIGGGVSATYTTPALTFADGGAAYAVTVTSGSETVTSAAATLTVTQPVAASGYFFVGVAGPYVDGSQLFANGRKSNGGPTHLVAVDAGAVGAVGAGAVVIDSGAQPILPIFDAAEATLGNGRLRDLRKRATAYFKGGRLYVVDQVSTRGLPPQPQLVSTLQTTDVCATDFGFPLPLVAEAGANLAAPLRSWMFFHGPGADGQCSTSDDVWRAVRYGMSSGDAPLTVGEPLNDIVDANGALAGIVMRQGDRLVRVDADLANPAPMFAIDPATFFSSGWQFGLAMPGRWLFFDAGKLWGVDLAAPAAKVELATLAADETAARALFRSDATGAFVALRSDTGARVIRISDALAVSTVASVSEPVAGMLLTGTRLVLRTSGTAARYMSLPKTGGATTTLLSLPVGRSVSTSSTSGEVFHASYRDASSPTLSTLVVNADGTVPEVLSRTKLHFTLQSPEISIVSRWSFTANQAYAVVLLETDASGNNANGTLWAQEGATRRRLVTYGQVAADGFNLLPTLQAPALFGQAGLLELTTASGDDLVYFNSGTAGLRRVTTLAR